MALREEFIPKPGDDGCDGPSYQEILDNDSRKVPDALRAQSVRNLETEGVPVEQYISEEYFALEAEHVWGRAWQLACREEEIPNTGDYIIYDIVDKSLLVTRTESGEIHAYHNSCLHRGRKLRTENGCAESFRCPYHGFTWNTDGGIEEVPCRWDFGHLSDEKLQLPEAHVRTWGGFVFISMAETPPDFDEVLGVVRDHFDANWPQEERYKSVHVAKIVHANWKAVAEAFMESYHVIDTHPQIMPSTGDANSQYDVFSDHVTRQISAMGVISPHLDASAYSQQDIVDSMVGRSRDMAGRDATLDVPDNSTARRHLAHVNRQAYSAASGHDADDASDAEILDAILYNVFPNMSVWAGTATNIVYRWRPNGNDVDSCIMEVMQLTPVPKGQSRPAPAQVHWMTDDQLWADAEEMSALGAVLDQDDANLPFMQEGMKASKTGVVNLGRYMEMRIRQLHETSVKYINGEY